MREVTSDIDKEFDGAFEDIDVSSDVKSERNSVSLTQIMEAYEESKQ